VRLTRNELRLISEALENYILGFEDDESRGAEPNPKLAKLQATDQKIITRLQEIASRKEQGNG
jgi:hypothetical protein